MPAGLDAARHDLQHGVGARAQVPPAGDPGLRRGVTDLERAEDHAVAQAVAVQAEPAANGSAGRIAPRTPPGPRLLDRGRSLQPGLDVVVAVDDARGVLGCRHARGDRGHDAVGVRAPSASRTFGERHAQPLRTRRHPPRPTGPGPTSCVMASQATAITQRAPSVTCSRRRARSLTLDVAFRLRRAEHRRRARPDHRGRGRHHATIRVVLTKQPPANMVVASPRPTPPRPGSLRHSSPSPRPAFASAPTVTVTRRPTASPAARPPRSTSGRRRRRSPRRTSANGGPPQFVRRNATVVERIELPAEDLLQQRLICGKYMLFHRVDGYPDYLGQQIRQLRHRCKPEAQRNLCTYKRDKLTRQENTRPLFVSRLPLDKTTWQQRYDCAQRVRQSHLRPVLRPRVSGPHRRIEVDHGCGVPGAPCTIPVSVR